MFQMAGVFAEFERSMIVARVNAGLATARTKGKKLGRPRTVDRKATAIREALEAGRSIRAAAKACGVGIGSVHRVKAAMAAEAA